MKVFQNTICFCFLFSFLFRLWKKYWGFFSWSVFFLISSFNFVFNYAYIFADHQTNTGLNVYIIHNENI